jgi:hypothetical protein
MFTALTLSLALGAPVPPPMPPVATGPAPSVVELKPNADGKVVVAVVRTEKVQLGAAIAPAPGGAGAAPPAVLTREMRVTKTVELGEVKDLLVTTADGKKLGTEDAVKKIGAGAVVVVSSDGKPVSPAFLKVFKDDTLVLSSPELAGPQGVTRPGVRPLPINRVPGGVQIQPIQPGNVQILPIQGGPAGGVIQIQIAPGGAAPAVLPAPVPVPVDKTPAKNEK